jgi:rhamnogalacturonyl hydrolase YesR
MRARHLAIGIICAFGLSTALQACQGEAPSSDVTQSAEDIFSKTHIQFVTDGVADWQLAHMELDQFAPFVPSFQDRSLEKRGWIQGAFFKGLADWAGATDNDEYFEWLRRFATEQEFRFEDRLYHADDHVVGQYYLTLYNKYKDPEMLAPMRKVFDQVIANPSKVSLDFGPKGTEEGYSHACLKRWCWADALFMAPPVLTELSAVTGDSKYLDFSDSEFWITTDYLFDKSESLFFRDSRFFEKREETGEKIFWSRGNGWVFTGIADVLDALPADHPSRARYTALYKDMAAKLITLQTDEGFWPVSLAAGEHYPVKETSGTAFFVAGLAWGVENGLLDEATYLPHIKRGWTGLNQSVTADGMIGSVQQVGFAPDKVSPNETQFYGAGAFLLAGANVLKLADKGLF